MNNIPPRLEWEMILGKKGIKGVNYDITLFSRRYLFKYIHTE